MAVVTAILCACSMLGQAPAVAVNPANPVTIRKVRDHHEVESSTFRGQAKSIVMDAARGTVMLTSDKQTPVKLMHTSGENRSYVVAHRIVIDLNKGTFTADAVVETSVKPVK